MLLRSSIVNTKKFFQKTLNNFKSMFSPGYERLPKTPNHHHSQFSYSLALPAAMDMDMNSHNHNNPSYEDLEKFYDSFTQQWDSQNDKARKGSSNKKKTVLLSSSSPTRQEAEVYDRRLVSASPVQNKKEKKNDQIQVEKREENANQNNKRMMMMISHHQRGKERNWIVEKKLRELEMLDKGNVDHVMDIEEVLHYYSRLTCPAYLEIVEKFFTEMYSEFFGLPPPPPATNASPSSVKSRLKHRSMRS